VQIHDEPELQEKDTPRMSTVAIILAAGKGMRMRSRLPKVAHRLAGRPLIAHVHAAVTAVPAVTPLYVLGYQHEAIQALLPEDVLVVLQEEPRGTGHALQCALSALPADCEEVLVLYGDMPLLSSATLEGLRQAHRDRGALLTLLSCEVAAPFGYGRVVRDAAGAPVAVVEEKELTDDQRTLTEINTGVYAIRASWLPEALAALPEHGDGEYYLTDLVADAARAGGLHVVVGDAPEEVVGINDRRQLADAEQVLRVRINRELMDRGVTIIDPSATYVAADAAIGMDTVIEPNVWIGEGVTIGEGCVIGMNSHIVASAIGNRCVILSSVLEYAQVEDEVHIGPFSHLRVGAVLANRAQIGNFAEIKNSTVGAGAKVRHFSYVGDAILGAGVNFGAGAITANYDGAHKHHTEVGDHAFIGSGSILRAPVRIGAGAYTGAGSVVTHDVAEGALVVGVPARPVESSSVRRRDTDV
jgi:bifunctional UDP-N-acetylglucosamine pyrophosphorylase/glucosamine-1-phosphate N-acetyltransferase